jgi:hypothetical protein
MESKAEAGREKMIPAGSVRMRHLSSTATSLQGIDFFFPSMTVRRLVR